MQYLTCMITLAYFCNGLPRPRNALFELCFGSNSAQQFSLPRVGEEQVSNGAEHVRTPGSLTEPYRAAAPQAHQGILVEVSFCVQ